MFFYKMVGMRILEELNQKNLKQEDLANKLDISNQEMNKILNGEKYITIVEIRNIADILNVEANALLKPYPLDNSENSKIQFLLSENIVTEIKEGTIDFSKLTKKKEYKPTVKY